jgi:hypothetical protein
MKIFNVFLVVLSLSISSCCNSVDCFECATPDALTQPIIQLDTTSISGFTSDEIRSMTVFNKEPFNNFNTNRRIVQSEFNREDLINFEELNKRFVSSLEFNFTPLKLVSDGDTIATIFSVDVVDVTPVSNSRCCGSCQQAFVSSIMLNDSVYFTEDLPILISKP